MTWLIIFAVAITVTVLLIGNKKKGYNYRIEPWFQEKLPYINKKPLTDTESIFYHRLVTALPDCIVLSQVQLSSFIKVKRQASKFEYNKWFYPIAQQSVDYLVCLKDFSIVAAIELDDKSHDNETALKRDEKKSRNIKAAGITLVRWHAEAMPDIEKIREEFYGDKNSIAEIKDSLEIRRIATR